MNSTWLFDYDCHINNLPTEVEAIDDPLKRLIESLKKFKELKTECNDKINQLSTCHSLVGNVITKDINHSIKPFNNVKLVLAGPTHSGKSTLINTLLGCQLMPSGGGHTSGRICVLAHSTTIRVRFFKVIPQQGVEPSKLKCIDSETITLDTRRQLQECMTKHLVRPKKKGDADDSNADNDNDIDPLAFPEWASKIVMVEFPSALLETGLEIIDVPGFSVSDDASLFSIRKQFFSAYYPTGVMFCYPNTISDAEVQAVSDLLNSLPNNDWSNNKSCKPGSNIDDEFIFFANTKTSKKEVAVNNFIELDEEVPLELIDSHSTDCFSKLKSSSLSASMDIVDRRFAIVNALDFVSKPKSMENRHIFKQFVNRLIKWMARLTQRHCDLVLRMVELESHSMSIKVRSIQSYVGDKLDDMANLHKEADTLLEYYVMHIVAVAIKIFEKLVQDIRTALFSDEAGLEIDQYQANIYKAAQRDKAFQLGLATRLFFDGRIKNVINEFEARFVKEIGLNKFLTHEHGDDEDIIVMQFKLTFDDFETNFSSPFARLLSSTIAGDIRSKMFEGFLRHFTAKAQRNKDFKSLVAIYPDTVDYVSLQEDVGYEIRKQVAVFRALLSSRLGRLVRHVKLASMSPQNVDLSKAKYQALYIETLELNCRLHFPFEMDSLKVSAVPANVVAQSDCGTVYSGTFRNQTYMVQVAPPKYVIQHNSNKVAMYARLGKSTTNDTTMLPMHAIFKRPISSAPNNDGANNNDQVEWLLLYKQCRPLIPYLKENISKMTLAQSLSMITRVAMAVQHLHTGVYLFRGIVHENVKLEFMYTDMDTKDVYLSMFGDVKEGQVTCEDPSLLSQISDLSLLGVAIVELLPKPMLRRYTIEEILSDPKRMIESSNSIPAKYRDTFIELVELCFMDDATIKHVVSKLVELNNYLFPST
ncbi:hypothetical protein SAMD00019534_114510 [Acytostelium subglobosum LB1]|uniref:hypothetical protein n=1 Tax=Acytostelium subglobosum LB1 TaxID=1410327 RepID=UPI0006450689|nr:hypothetical protein SAMD00019534_114510 [Acytostelium subglobosum LB1]GAM28275.1 hypothetical protein SAMD00019534_114510 [Acytostelium subglobosum LB1]|eukprot:XP_012748909.1 hypothetical protein SAMD00019534_114510 [Acytostelium subglobosum LB1]